MESPIEISIVIPTFNRKLSLERTLMSLVEQTYPMSKYEVIVCDDISSNDGTEQLVKELMSSNCLNIKYYKVESIYPGPSAPRNLGVKKSSGSIIGFIDDDCVAFSSWIEQGAKTILDENMDVVQGSVIPKYPPFEVKNIFKMPRGIAHTKDNGFYVTANLFMKKKTFLESGGFDEEIKWGEDTDLVYRSLRNGARVKFSDCVKVDHDMEYLNLLTYRKYLKNFSYLPLQIKRNPEMRANLIFGLFSNKSNIYPAFLFLSLTFSLFNLINYFYVFFILAMIFYFYSRVFVDSKRFKYIIRIAAFPRNLFVDFFRLFYLLKGSLKYRIIVL